MNEGKEDFYLDTENGSVKCHIITEVYDEETKKYYLIYEAEDDLDNCYVSSIVPGNLQELNDVTSEELERIKELINEQ